MMASPAVLSAQTIAEQTASVALDQARFNLQKAQLDSLTALKSQTAGTAAVQSGADTTEAMLLRNRAFQGAAAHLVRELTGPTGRPALPAGSPAPLVVMGSTPPPVSQWLVFQESAAATQKALKDAVSKWGPYHNPKSYSGRVFMAVVPVAVAAITTAISLLHVDSAINGAVLKADDVTISNLLDIAFAKQGYAIDYSAFAIGGDGAAVAETLLAGEGLGHDYIERVQSLAGEYAAAKARFSSGKSPDGKFDPSLLADDEFKVYAAGESLNAALASYATLKSGLLAPTNGQPNAILVAQQRRWASAAGKPAILYILSTEGNLTTITKKGVFIGLHSTPAELRVLARINYVFVGPTARERGSVACLLKAKFDTVSLTTPPSPAGPPSGAGCLSEEAKP